MQDHNHNNGETHDQKRSHSLFAQLLDENPDSFQPITAGMAIDGTYLGKAGDALLLDIGSKSEGVVPRAEYSSLSVQELAQLEIGDEMLVVVLHPEGRDGEIVLSIDRARQERRWRLLRIQQETGELITATVSNSNKGGLVLQMDGVRGFVPASQVSTVRGSDPSAKESELARLVGQTLTLKVLEVDQAQNRLILSERQATQERRKQIRDELLNTLTVGERKEGTISAVTDFGAFIDLGGIDGLIHFQELSWERIGNAHDVVRTGQHVAAIITSIDRAEGRVSLSLRRATTPPWEKAMSEHQLVLRQNIEATVYQQHGYGLLVRLPYGLEGLLHHSLLTENTPTTPGSTLAVQIVWLDNQRGQAAVILAR